MFSNPLEIAGALSEAECVALAHVARGATGNALEVGHYLGRSTAVLLLALPAEVGFTTVDHHQGDEWCPDTDPDVFRRNVEAFVGPRDFMFVHGAMCEFVVADEVAGRGPFGFVFYDADHTKHAVVDWWNAYRGMLAGSCVLAFDDADWDDQSVLGELARADGFVSVRDREFYRGPEDKRDPETFTLEVMRRG